MLNAEEEPFHNLGLWRHYAGCYDYPEIMAMVRPELLPTEVVEGWWQRPFDFIYRRNDSFEGFKEIARKINKHVLGGSDTEGDSL